MLFPDPWPKKKPIAWMTAITEKAIPTAPDALVLIFPIKNVSAIL